MSSFDVRSLKPIDSLINFEIKTKEDLERAEGIINTYFESMKPPMPDEAQMTSRGSLGGSGTFNRSSTLRSSLSGVVTSRLSVGNSNGGITQRASRVSIGSCSVSSIVGCSDQEKTDEVKPDKPDDRPLSNWLPPYNALLPPINSSTNTYDSLLSISKLISRIGYNYQGYDLVSVQSVKRKPYSQVAALTRKILHKGMPVRCLESVLLALQATSKQSCIRIPLRFQTALCTAYEDGNDSDCEHSESEEEEEVEQEGGQTVLEGSSSQATKSKARLLARTSYWHIVLAVWIPESSSFVSIGLSRRAGLGSRGFESSQRYDSLSSLVAGYIHEYARIGHAVKTVVQGLPPTDGFTETVGKSKYAHMLIQPSKQYIEPTTTASYVHLDTHRERKEDSTIPSIQWHMLYIYMKKPKSLQMQLEPAHASLVDKCNAELHCMNSDTFSPFNAPRLLEPRNYQKLVQVIDSFALQMMSIRSNLLQNKALPALPMCKITPDHTYEAKLQLE